MSTLTSGRFVLPALGLGEVFFGASYGTPETREAFAEMGFADRQMDYFAARSAPMGAVPVEVAISAAFGFHPDKVRRYIPAAWELASPDEILDVQRRAVDVALTRLLGGWTSSPDAAEIAATTRSVAEHCDVVGRPLTAGLASLPWPEEPHMVIWHAFTILRELRGDSHNAVLVANGFDGCDCHPMMMAGAAGGCACHAAFSRFAQLARVETPPDPSQGADREWPVADKRRAVERLRDRGLLDDDFSITPAGMELHLEMERDTDAAAVAACARQLDAPEVERVAELMAEPVQLIRKGLSLPV